MNNNQNIRNILPSKLIRFRQLLCSHTSWHIGLLLILCIVLLPLFSIILLATQPVENTWEHLWKTVLWDYIKNTILLMSGVSLLSSIMGISSAWMTVRYRFFGVHVLKYALLLPLAMPAYVVAYVYTDLLDYSGIIQSTLRNLFNWQSRQDYWFFEIRSLSGAVLMLSFVLYPYVYLLARSAFLNQSLHLEETAITLGTSSIKRFFKLSLPIARPAIAVGIMLVLMETLNDFGTVDYFSVNTLNRALWDRWRDRDLGSASQLALTLLGVAIFLITIEKYSRRKQRQYQQSIKQHRSALQLRGFKNITMFLLCLLPVLVGFFIPAMVLLQHSIIYYELSLKANVLAHAFNSVLLASSAAILATAIGLFIAYAKRLKIGGRVGGYLIEASGFGYGFPGAVLAVGLIVPLASFDNAVDLWMESHFGIRTGLLLTGTVFMVIYAYVVRFLVIAKGSIEANLNLITPSMDMAAQNLGLTPFKRLLRVHLPLVKNGMLTGMILIFVDCMKELPATLILRPFGLETLATFVYQYTSDELLKESAFAALLIVLAGLLPVIFLSKTLKQP